jgi:hypothetical protein
MDPSRLLSDWTGEIELAGHKLWIEHASIEAPCRSLWPLGGALVEGAMLYALLQADPSGNHKVSLARLFDGGESEGPNIETRLKCIRDLCSASIFALEDRSANLEVQVGDVMEPIETPGVSYWCGLLSTCFPQKDNQAVTEVARLLDDVFSELVRITICLQVLAEENRPDIWPEIWRAASHIRDHFDYAEEIVIDSIVAAEE